MKGRRKKQVLRMGYKLGLESLYAPGERGTGLSLEKFYPGIKADFPIVTANLLVFKFLISRCNDLNMLFMMLANNRSFLKTLRNSL